jgi:hypothetical protein
MSLCPVLKGRGFSRIERIESALALKGRGFSRATETVERPRALAPAGMLDTTTIQL